MHFKNISFSAVALAATSAQAMMSARELADSLSAMAEMSNEIIRTSEAVDANTIEQMMPKLDRDFSTIIRESMETISNLDTMERNPEVFNADEQKLVCSAMKNAVDVSKDVVTSVVGEDVETAPNPFAKNMVRILQVVEKAVESLATGTLDLVPSCSEDVDNKLTSLRSALEKGATKFQVETRDAPMMAANMKMADMENMEPTDMKANMNMANVEPAGMKSNMKMADMENMNMENMNMENMNMENMNMENMEPADMKTNMKMADMENMEPMDMETHMKMAAGTQNMEPTEMNADVKMNNMENMEPADMANMNMADMEDMENMKPADMANM